MTRQSNLFIAFTIVISALLLGMFAYSALGLADRVETDEDFGKPMVPLRQPSLSFGNPSSGPREAAVTLFSFGDYQCEPCAQMNDTLVQLRAEFPNDLRVVWKDMPNEAQHPLAVAAANAARCAGDQGRFWDYHALLMEQKGVLVDTNFPIYAAGLGLNQELFNSCLTNKRNVPLVERDLIEAQRLNINATPMIFIGEQRHAGAKSIEEMRSIITAEIAKAKAGATDGTAPIQ